MKQKQRITLLGMVAAALILAACGGDSSTGGVGGGSDGMLTDSRDGQVYYTVVIGTQTWMAENLNYAVDSSWCYENSADSCAKYGRLYQWAAAMALPAAYNEATWGGYDVNHQGVCPAGWHLPTNTEWTTLENAVGGDDVAGTALKSTSGWYDDDEYFVPGMDTYGFSMLPAGDRYSNGYFYKVGIGTYFWSATEFGTGNAYTRNFDYDCEYSDSGMGTDSDFIKNIALSVRCLKN
jgi:uncharacterized protein (TIGR02145 family)